MPTDPITPASVARLLTPAQRAALLALPADGSMGVIADRSVGDVIYVMGTLEIRGDVYARLTCPASSWDGEKFALTPLGVRVRREVAGDG